MEQLIKVRRKPAEISIKDSNAGFSVAKRKERCSGSEIIMISDHCATLPFNIRDSFRYFNYYSPFSSHRWCAVNDVPSHCQVSLSMSHKVP